MFQKILIPLDGSALAAAALLPASELARRSHAELVLVGAISPSNIAEIGAYLATMVKCLSAEGLAVRAILPQGSPEDGISKEAELVHADLIVMTTHGRTGLDALLHPSVTWKVLAQTNAPILVWRYSDTEQADPPVQHLPFMADSTAPILVPLDGSLQAERVLPFARETAQKFGNPLVLLRVGDPLLLAEGAGAQDLTPGGSVGWWMDEAEAYLREKQAELIKAGLQVTRIVTLGRPAAIIRAAAQEHHAGLIVIASRGRGWLSRLVMGSVARSVLNESETPVLLIRRFLPVEVARTDQLLAEASAW